MFALPFVLRTNSISCCQSNGVGAMMNGDNFTVVGNVFTGNRQECYGIAGTLCTELMIRTGAKGGRVSANVGAPDAAV